MTTFSNFKQQIKLKMQIIIKKIGFYCKIIISFSHSIYYITFIKKKKQKQDISEGYLHFFNET